MKEYIVGLIRNFLNPKVSKFALIDNKSSISQYARIKPFTKVFNSTVAEYSYIGRGSSLYYTKVGKFCSIGMDCKIGLPSHTLSKISTSPIFTEKNNATGTSWATNDSVNPYKEVLIGNDVWIGDNCLVLGGLNIGNGSVVGAGAVVTKNVPPYAIVAGVPAKILRFRFSEEINSMLEDSKWWELDSDRLKEIILFFQKDNKSVDDIKTFITKVSKNR